MGGGSLEGKKKDTGKWGNREEGGVPQQSWHNTDGFLTGSDMTLVSRAAPSPWRCCSTSALITRKSSNLLRDVQWWAPPWQSNHVAKQKQSRHDFLAYSSIFEKLVWQNCLHTLRNLRFTTPASILSRHGEIIGTPAPVSKKPRQVFFFFSFLEDRLAPVIQVYVYQDNIVNV